MCALSHQAWAGEEKQIKLEDIEQDSLIEETERADEPQHHKELQQPQPQVQVSQHSQHIQHTQHSQHPQQTQHIQLSYSNDPQDIFVTPMPGRYAPKGRSETLKLSEPKVDSETLPAAPADLRSQLYHLPKVHEAEQTYTVPAKQTLIQPMIGGSQPIQPLLTPQPQYIYIQSPQSHQPYMPQAQ